MDVPLGRCVRHEDGVLRLSVRLEEGPHHGNHLSTTGQQAARVNGAQERATSPELAGAPPRATTLDWGNSAPLALFAFAVTTFMLSMVNADAIAKGVEPVVFGVALMFSGLTQLIAASNCGSGTPSPVFCSPASVPSGCRCSRSCSGS
jgi:GPR1/FUN34/yaaH family